MSDKSKTEGHWETKSASSKSVKVGNHPAEISGKEASAEGTFDVSEFLLHLYRFHTVNLFSMANQL
jgi:hypothetical protein